MTTPPGPVTLGRFGMHVHSPLDPWVPVPLPPAAHRARSCEHVGSPPAASIAS